MKQRISGVYSITCQPTGEQYIGSSLDVEKRWSVHRSHLRSGNHPSKLLQQRYTVYGADAFSYVVVDTVSENAQLRDRESHWIELLCPALNTIGTPREAELWRLSKRNRTRPVKIGAYGKAVPRLRALREAQAWSVHELAKAAGISHTTITSAEKGAHVRWATVRALAKALDVTPLELCNAAPTQMVTA